MSQQEANGSEDSHGIVGTLVPIFLSGPFPRPPCSLCSACAFYFFHVRHSLSLRHSRQTPNIVVIYIASLCVSLAILFFFYFLFKNIPWHKRVFVSHRHKIFQAFLKKLDIFGWCFESSFFEVFRIMCSSIVCSSIENSKIGNCCYNNINDRKVHSSFTVYNYMSFT